MSLSPIDVAVHRLRECEHLQNILVEPVRPSDGECVVINRRFETGDDNVHALLAVTIFTDSFRRLEHIGDQIVDVLKDGDVPWSYEEAEDVLFEKLGGDVTGYDDARRQFVRTIDFGVSW